MSDRSAVSARMFLGLIVLTLGVAWTLDNLGLVDASHLLRWWPAIALGWGLMCLTGLGCRQQTGPGLFWTIVGGVSLLNTLDLIHVSIFELWPIFLIIIGGSIVLRGWHGASSAASANEIGATFNTFAFMAGAERKVVSQEFRRGDVSAVMGGASVDFRSAGLADGRAVVDVFAMWGGIDLIVPAGWRVVGEVTPILGGFEDSTEPPVDPSAPTLVVKGTVMMGGVEVKNETGRRLVHVNPGGVAGVVIGRVRSGEHKEVRIDSSGIVVRRGPISTAPPNAASETRPVEPE